MSTFSRRRMTIAGLSGVSLAAAGFLAPGALAANTIDGDVAVSNTETVQVLMNASGKIDAQRVYEQLVLRGDGKVDISNPVSSKGLRNLDGFGGFDVQDGKQRIKTDVDGTKKFRSVSSFTKDLPVDIDISYTFDGKKVEPGDIVGKSGDLKVRYLVTNTTGKTEDVVYKDGNGKDKTASQEVVIPMVGSLTTVLPSTFTKVKSAEANAAGDGRGGTQLSFTMTLIPPIGKATAEFGYEARVTDGVIPKASVSVLPVNPLESPSFKGGAASYKGGADTGQDLTAGATEIDANVLKLRDGASDLVSGILKLQDGANKLSTGLQKDAAPGAGKLAAGADELNAGADKLAGGTGDLSAGAGKLDDGASKLDAGAGKLNKGATDLSDGLKKAGSGAPALIGGLNDVSDGLDQVDAGLTQLNGQVVPGAKTISAGAAQLIGAIDTQLAPGLDGVTGALNQALQVAGGLEDPQKAQLTALLNGAKDGVATIKGGLTGSVKPGLADIKGGGDSIASGVEGATGASGSLKLGTGKLVAGVDKLQAGGAELATGLGKLSDGADKLEAGAGDLESGTGDLKSGTGDLKSGANQLNAGAGKLKIGTGKLSTGAGTLATGLNTAAAGSGQLAAGLDTAAEGAPALPKGAKRLSKEGTSVLVGKGNATAVDYGLKYALIEAGATRAASAQPYGSPEGATALTAYKFDIAGENGADTANMKRGLAAIVLLAGAGVFAAVRRRMA